METGKHMKPATAPSAKFTYEDFLILARAAELTAEAGDILTTPLLPEFSVSLVDLFAMPL